jgi:phosphate transport system permease protein
VHLAEFPHSKFSSAVRFAADVLNGVPSIVIGIFAYAVMVYPVKRFSAIAGGFALGLLMIPMVVRTTEELLRLVPPGLREGALALGATRGRAVRSVILPAALPGILTGVLVALARVAGETAPLLFTSFNNSFFSTRLTQPMASLTYQVWIYANSPYDDWHRQAWAGAFLLVMIILSLSIIARLSVGRLERMNRP